MAYLVKEKRGAKQYFYLHEKISGRLVRTYLGTKTPLPDYVPWKGLAPETVLALKSKCPDTPDMPTGKYDIIYADPPWRYDFNVGSRATENHYPTLTLKQIRTLRDKKGVHIQDKIESNAILYLWATAPKLNEAMEVLKAWGFTYKTNMVWVKDKIGLGWYARNQHELLLIGEKGEMPLPNNAVRPPSVLSFQRTTHSTKPLEMYSLLERWYPSRAYLEVFGTKNDVRPSSWGVFGNNVYK